MENSTARPIPNRSKKFMRDIDKMEKSTVTVNKYQEYRDLFPACIMAGCVLLVSHGCFFCRKRSGKNCHDHEAG